MKKSRKTTGRFAILIGGCLIAVGAAWFLFSGPAGIVSMYRSGKELRRLQTEMARAHARVDSLTAEIERLKSDTVYIEKMAREKLGMARPGEKIYKFIEQDK
jgi:cell division protein FtsB